VAIYQLPDLGYEYGALEPHLSARILELHHGKHHRAYVDGANSTLERLELVREAGDYSALVGLERTLAFNVSGHVLHSIFWENLTPGGTAVPSGELGDAINDHFGDFDYFKSQMSQAAIGVQGSGWAALTWEPVGERLVIEQIHDHQSNSVQGATLLLVIDAWEHAYYLEYENRRPDYVTAIWNIINWPNVAKRFANATLNSGTAGY
jgi:Fe-Mn family superoxide dismutase